MKIRKSILEAINRGVQLALDDYDDELISSSKSNIVKNIDTKELWDFYNNFVDLGLPSGTLWCKYNLGAKKPEDIGNYYAWGETQTKNNFNMDTYKYFVFNNKFFIPDMLKYNNKDNLTNLQLEDDAAYQYDNRMKIPTKEQFKELLNYTILTWEDNYNDTGVSGVLFSKNNQELFIPVSGHNVSTDNETSKFINEDECYLWTSNNYKICGDAWYISFDMHKGKFDYDFYCGRCSDGLPIRPVLNK